MAVSPPLPNRLNAVERDALRAVGELCGATPGRHIACGIEELAERAQTSIRTANRTLARLQQRGLLERRRRGRNTGTIALTKAALPHCGTATVSLPLIAKVEQKKAPLQIPVPPNFCGDLKALTMVHILEQPAKRTVAPVDLAKRYWENAADAEKARLELLKDDGELYPEIFALTGHGGIDEGLRQLALNKRRTEMALAAHRKLIAGARLRTDL